MKGFISLVIPATVGPRPKPNSSGIAHSIRCACGLYLEGQDYIMVAGPSQDHTITSCLLEGICVGLQVQFRYLELNCQHRSAVALRSQVLNPSRLCSVLS